MTRIRGAALAGVAASALAIVVTIVSGGAVRERLAQNYAYPNAAGVGLDEAASMTLTYLFVIAGGGLIVALAYAFSRALGGTRQGWWLGMVLVLLGVVLVGYNLTQEFSLAVKLVFVLPVLAGAVWLALPEAGKRAPRSVD